MNKPWLWIGGVLLAVLFVASGLPAWWLGAVFGVVGTGVEIVTGLVAGVFGLFVGLASAAFGLLLAGVSVVAALLIAALAVAGVLLLLASPLLALAALVWLVAAVLRERRPPPAPAEQAPALPVL